MAAGSAPIDSIAGALDRANQAINGPLWQGTLTSIFSSMATAANLAFQGVGSLGTAFVSLAPTLSTILPLIGRSSRLASTASLWPSRTPPSRAGWCRSSRAC